MKYTVINFRLLEFLFYGPENIKLAYIFGYMGFRAENLNAASVLGASFTSLFGRNMVDGLQPAPSYFAPKDNTLIPGRSRGISMISETVVIKYRS